MPLGGICARVDILIAKKLRLKVSDDEELPALKTHVMLSARIL